MAHLGFAQIWIDKVMNCISTASFAILLNGEAYGSFSTSRVLRQGDPLSPYLFLLCVEGLSHMVTRTYLNVPISWLCAPITHLLFADDCLIFSKVNAQEMGVIKNILNVYALASLSIILSLLWSFRLMFCMIVRCIWNRSF